MKEIDGTEPEDQVDDTIFSAIKADNEDMLEENYLEPLYGTLSRMPYIKWLKRS